MTGRNLVFISFPLHFVASKISSSALYEKVFSWTFKTYIEQNDFVWNPFQKEIKNEGQWYMFVNSLGSLINLQLFSANVGQFSVPQY